jgi:hypothetical protein
MAQIPDLQAQMVERLWTAWLIDQKEFDSSRITGRVWVSPWRDCGKNRQLQAFHFREGVAKAAHNFRHPIKFPGMEFWGDHQHRQSGTYATGLAVNNLVSGAML